MNVMMSVEDLCRDLENYHLLTELRRRGLAVTAIGDEDVLMHVPPAAGHDHSVEQYEQAEGWLDANRDAIEIAMSEAGVNAIADLTATDGRAMLTEALTGLKAQFREP